MTARSAVALPELPLLAVLPGTGGLTRVTDKRKVRRDHADVFCTIEEGIKGKRAVAWRLVDEVVPQTPLEARARERAGELARNRVGPTPRAASRSRRCERSFNDDAVDYGFVNVAIDRAKRSATSRCMDPIRRRPQTSMR